MLPVRALLRSLVRALPRALPFVALIALAACRRGPSVSATPDEAWTAVFRPAEGPFLGADGVYTIDWRGARWAFFSDTLVGGLDAEGVRTDSHFVHNSVARIDPDQGLVFEPEAPVEDFLAPDREEHWFWLGHAVEAEDALLLFAYRHHRRGTNDVWDFALEGCAVAVLEDTPPAPPARLVELPFCHPQRAWGLWALVEEGHLYLYGIDEPDKHLLLARRPVAGARQSPATGWRFWDGADWSENPDDAASLIADVSNELGLVRIDDGWRLVYLGHGFSNEVRVADAPALTGPFGPPEVVYRPPEQENPVFTYNAKPHPALSDEGGLVVSYNVNTVDFWGDFRRLHTIYYPRFLRLNPE